MHILINAISARQGGGQTYLINLLQFLPAGFGHDITVLAPGSLSLPQPARVRRLASHAALENPLLRAAWERSFLPGMVRELQADVLFDPGGTSTAAAPTGCRSVTMFRNMIPFDLAVRRRYPPGYQRARNWWLHRAMLGAMRRADLVIFISEYARRVVEQEAGGALKRSVCIPHGVNPRFRTTGASRPAWLPPGDYLLYVSTLDYYKAQVEVVRAYALLRQRRATPEKLLLVGPENPGSDYSRILRAEVARLGLGNEVIFAGQIPYDGLPAVYEHALIKIFASECENCPNILLEALAAGRPILCSNRPPMPEFGGDAVMYFDPADPAALADRLEVLIDDRPAQAALGAKARQRSLRHDWEESARATWAAIAALDREPRR